jgi:hypothetical protein
MDETPGGDVLLTGVTDSLGMNLSMFLLCFDSGCGERFGISNSLRFHASGDLLEVSENGDIYLAGETGFERDDGYFLPPVDEDVFLMKFNSSGEELWSSIFPQPLQNTPLCMYTAGDSVLILTSSSHEDGSRPQGPPYSICMYAP